MIIILCCCYYFCRQLYNCIYLSSTAKRLKHAICMPFKVSSCYYSIQLNGLSVLWVYFGVVPNCCCCCMLLLLLLLLLLLYYYYWFCRLHTTGSSVKLSNERWASSSELRTLWGQWKLRIRAETGLHERSALDFRSRGTVSFWTMALADSTCYQRICSTKEGGRPYLEYSGSICQGLSSFLAYLNLILYASGMRWND